jgi:DmsE family decaheme c-type cytochrome
LLACLFAAGFGDAPAVALDAAPADAAPAASSPVTVSQAVTGPQSPRATGDAVCTRCHDELENKPILSIYQTKHGVRGDPSAPTCQSCHGSSENHLRDKKFAPDTTFGAQKSPAKAQDAACLGCHAGEKRMQWGGAQHQANDIACTSCHRVHLPADPVLARKSQSDVCFTCHREQRADNHKVSTHPSEVGKVACSDCHNLHGSAGPRLLKRNTVLETCFTCHAEKRGPFLWEHQPVTEDCTNCHDVHGSNFTPLLKSRPPFLCDECHSGPHNSPIPYGPGAVVGRPGVGAPNQNVEAQLGDQSAAGRACMNCHVMVHGSNAPSGAFLHR